MTAEATPENVRGDFSGATLVSAGVTARMDRDARGGYRMTFTAPGAAPRTVEVARTVGSRRYQQYLAREGDAYWRLPVAWHLEEHRWFPMTSAFLFSDPSDHAEDVPGRPVYGGGDFDRHVTRWNDNCVFCHNVAPDPGRDPRSGRFATTVAELGIACEACHGPGAEHVARNADPLRRWALASGGAADPTIVNPSRLSPSRAADLAVAATGSGSPTRSRPCSSTAIRSSPATIWRSRARRSGATPPSRRPAGVRRAILGGGDASPHRLRIPGPAAIAVRHARPAHLHQLSRHA